MSVSTGLFVFPEMLSNSSIELLKADAIRTLDVVQHSYHADINLLGSFVLFGHHIVKSRLKCHGTNTDMVHR